MQTATLKIIGMHCTSCAMNIDFELEDLVGVKESSTNYAKQETVVTYDPQTVSLEKITDTIKNLEYDVQSK